MYEYTDEEYQYLEQPGWTRTETDRLFALCRQFDLRFVVIEDRFNPPDARPPLQPFIPLQPINVPPGHFYVCQNSLELSYLTITLLLYHLIFV
jgi:hypothetical protein